MATETKKKRSLEEFFADSFSPGAERKDYVTVETPEGKVVSKSATSTATVDPKTKNAVVDSGAINVDGVMEEPKVAPAAPVVEEKKPEGPYKPMDAQDPTRAQPTLKQTIFGTPQPDASGWERAMIGATPLLVGLLSGNTLEGAQTSSNYFVKEEGDRYKRTKDLNQKLAELQLKRETASTNGKDKFDKEKVYNPETGKTEVWSILNGKRYEFLGLDAPDAQKDKFGTVVVESEKFPGRYETWSTRNGQKFENLGKDFRKEDVVFKEAFNPETGKNAYKMYTKSGDDLGWAAEMAKDSSDNREDRKDSRFEEAQMNQVVKDFRNKNSKFSVAQEDATNIVKAADLLNKPNPFSDEGIKSFFARSVFAEKGPLSDFDLARLAGSGALDDVAVRNIQRWRDGNRITNEDAAAMRQVLDSVYPYIKQKAMGELDGTIKAYPKYSKDLGPRLRAYVDGNFPALPLWANPRRDNVNINKNVMKTLAKSVPEGYRKFHKGNQTATIPVNDSKAISEILDDGFQEIK